jgi:hypothetical protein
MPDYHHPTIPVEYDRYRKYWCEKFVRVPEYLQDNELLAYMRSRRDNVYNQNPPPSVIIAMDNIIAALVADILERG